MTTITIDSAAIQRALGNLAQQLDDLTPVMRKIAGTMASAIEENFDTEGARLGARWNPSRRAIKQGGKTLQDTGRLAGSMITRVTRLSAEVGTNVEYGPIHQFGGTARFKGRSVTMPKRPFLGLNAVDEQSIVDTIQAALARALKT